MKPILIFCSLAAMRRVGFELHPIEAKQASLRTDAQIIIHRPVPVPTVSDDEDQLFDELGLVGKHSP